MKLTAARRRFSFQTQSTTRDSRGARVDTWVEAFRFWGDIRRTASRIQDEPGSRRSEDRFTIPTRYKPGFVIGGRVVDLETSAVYDVEAVFDPQGRRRWLELTVFARPADSPG